MRVTALALALVAVFAAVALGAVAGPPPGTPATCRHQSGAAFPGTAQDLVVGPLVLVSGRGYSSPELVKKYGRQKYPAVVLAGHRAVVEVPREVRRSTSLLYGEQTTRHEGPPQLSDGQPVVDFRSCSAGDAQSSYGRRKATFWSGFILTSVPRCLKLRVWIDDERAARVVHIPLGKRCN